MSPQNSPFTLLYARHHDGDALVDDPLEVGEVDLVQGDLVDLDVDLEARVLHRVAREVLHAGHHVALDAAGQRCPDLADVVRILAVGLLCPSPRRVAEHVHAHAAVEVGTDGSELAADGVADALLEVEVPRRAASHGDGEAGGAIDDDAPRAVAEREPRQPEPLDPCGVEGALW